MGKRGNGKSFRKSESIDLVNLLASARRLLQSNPILLSVGKIPTSTNSFEDAALHDMLLCCYGCSASSKLSCFLWYHPTRIRMGLVIVNASSRLAVSHVPILLNDSSVPRLNFFSSPITHHTLPITFSHSSPLTIHHSHLINASSFQQLPVFHKRFSSSTIKHSFFVNRLASERRLLQCNPILLSVGKIPTSTNSFGDAALHDMLLCCYRCSASSKLSCFLSYHPTRLRMGLVVIIASSRLNDSKRNSNEL